MLSREHHGPRAVLNALERLAGGYGSECTRVRQDLAIAELQLRDYQARLGKPFLHDVFLSELRVLRDQHRAGLSSKSPEQGSESQPSVSELAEKFRVLRAANIFESTPERAGKRTSTGEEPVNAIAGQLVQLAAAGDVDAIRLVLQATSQVTQPTHALRRRKRGRE